MLTVEYLSYVFFVLFGVQFLFPLMAAKIKTRFRELGYEMKSEPAWSLLNITRFWSEAREQNHQFNDPAITKYLRLRTAWWVLVGATFAGFLALGS